MLYGVCSFSAGRRETLSLRSTRRMREGMCCTGLAGITVLEAVMHVRLSIYPGFRVLKIESPTGVSSASLPFTLSSTRNLNLGRRPVNWRCLAFVLDGCRMRGTLWAHQRSPAAETWPAVWRQSEGNTEASGQKSLDSTTFAVAETYRVAF